MSRFIVLTRVSSSPDGSVVERPTRVLAECIATFERVVYQASETRSFATTRIWGSHGVGLVELYVKELPDVIESMIEKALDRSTVTTVVLPLNGDAMERLVKAVESKKEPSA